MIREHHGNLLNADAEALVNAVNTVGVMGKGIALQFKDAFPSNYAAYRHACDRNEITVGRIFVHELAEQSGPRYVLNFPTKRHWRSPSRLSDIRAGLADLREVILRLRIGSLAVPALGCGNGGLSWSDVRSLITDNLGDLPDIDVQVFPPEGAPDPATTPVRTRSRTPRRSAFSPSTT